MFTTLAGGRYHTGKVLAETDGSGVVYAGIQVGLARTIAIKEFFPHAINRLVTRAAGGLMVTPDPGRARFFENWRQQFILTSRLLAALRSPRIVTVYDLLEENGTAYLVMERLRGATLAEHLGGLRRTDDGLVLGRRLPPTDAMPLLLAAVEALKVLHGRTTGPIMHLDLTPNNLFLQEGLPLQLTLLDCGLAWGGNNTVSNVSTIRIGDPAFMAPEQAELRGPANISPASDCYSLGACMYTAIVGIAPAPASGRRVGIKLVDLVSQVPGLEPNLATAIMACLNLDPASRPANAHVLHQHLMGGINSPIKLPIETSTVPHPIATVNQSSKPKVQFSPPVAVASHKSHTPIHSRGQPQLYQLRMQIHPGEAPKYITSRQQLRRRHQKLTWLLLAMPILVGVMLAWWKPPVVKYWWRMLKPTVQRFIQTLY